MHTLFPRCLGAFGLTKVQLVIFTLRFSFRLRSSIRSTSRHIVNEKPECPSFHVVSVYSVRRSYIPGVMLIVHGGKARRKGTLAGGIVLVCLPVLATIGLLAAFFGRRRMQKLRAQNAVTTTDPVWELPVCKVWMTQMSPWWHVWLIWRCWRWGISSGLLYLVAVDVMETRTMPPVDTLYKRTRHWPFVSASCSRWSCQWHRWYIWMIRRCWGRGISSGLLYLVAVDATGIED